MAEVTTHKCDGCGELRKEANHWFRGIVYDGKFFAIAPWDSFARLEDLTGFREARELHLCSEACAVKAMSKAIGRAP